MPCAMRHAISCRAGPPGRAGAHGLHLTAHAQRATWNQAARAQGDPRSLSLMSGRDLKTFLTVHRRQTLNFTKTEGDLAEMRWIDQCLRCALIREKTYPSLAYRASSSEVPGWDAPWPAGVQGSGLWPSPGGGEGQARGGGAREEEGGGSVEKGERFKGGSTAQTASRIVGERGDQTERCLEGKSRRKGTHSPRMELFQESSPYADLGVIHKLM